MAGTIASDMIPENHPNSFASQGYPKSVPMGLPRLTETASGSLIFPAGSETHHESLVVRLPSVHKTDPELPSAPLNPDRSSQFRSTEVLSMEGIPLDKPTFPLGPARIRRSLSAEPPSQEGEPDDTNAHRILCTNCDEWITTQDLDGNDKNSWAEHASICASQSALREATPSVIGDASTSISVTPAPTADSSEPKDTNTAFRRRKVKHYESERLALLQKDPQIEMVEEYRVLCSFCDKWVQLRKDRPYCPIAWTAHKLQCVNRRKKSGPASKKVKREHASTSVVPPEIPSPAAQIRRTEEERVQFLVSDPHATTVEPHRILCGICRRWIQLRKNSTYCTAPWVQHVKKCAAKHDTPRRTNGSSAGYPVDGDGEDEVESEEGVPRMQEPPEEIPPKRGRGRPRKRKFGQAKGGQPSFTLRPVSGTSPPPSNNQRANGRSSASPPPLRTPSPPLDHPYSNDMYWYPALPPMSSYYPLYAGSQYNENDDSYSLYFHAQPPAHQLGPTPGQGRFRAKPPKQMFLNPGNSPGPAVWHGPAPMPLPPGSTLVTSSSPGPDGSSPQPGRAWIVWRLKNYSTNPCPMDPSPAPDSHSSAAARGGSEVSGSGSEPLPMFRSGTWPHLLDPQDTSQTQNLSPYVHPEVAAGGKEDGSGPTSRSVSRSASFALPRPPPPPLEDPGMISFNSSAHIPIRISEPFVQQPQSPPLLPPLPPQPVPDPNIDPRFSLPPPPVGPFPPDAPTGADLDSPECRLAYTFQSIAYLFSTSFQGADDMSLDTLMGFMNRTIPPDKVYDGEEVGQHVAILGERKQLVFTKEGGVQLSASPP